MLTFRTLHVFARGRSARHRSRCPRAISSSQPAGHGRLTRTKLGAGFSARMGRVYPEAQRIFGTMISRAAVFDGVFRQGNMEKTVRSVSWPIAGFVVWWPPPVSSSASLSLLLVPSARTANWSAWTMTRDDMCVLDEGRGH